MNTWGNDITEYIQRSKDIINKPKFLVEEEKEYPRESDNYQFDKE